jgi:hypothetical protein
MATRQAELNTKRCETCGATGVNGYANWDIYKDLIAVRYQLTKDFEANEIQPVTFDRMNSPYYEGEKWAVRRGGSCLAKDGYFEYEPMPSSRDNDFYNRCRFDSLGSAVSSFHESQKLPPVPIANDATTAQSSIKSES